LFCISLAACSSAESEDAGFLISAFGFDHADNQVILSIPVDGCSGCARESIAFARDHYGNNNFYITLISDDIKEALYIKKEYFSDGEHVLTLDSREALVNQIDIQFPSYYCIAQSGTEKTVINAQTLQESLSSIKNKLEQHR
jgi:hypothetical protein